jgi:hypothetical protein
MRILVMALVLAQALAGCATIAARRSSGKPIYQFPSQSELSQVAASSAATRTLAPELASVEAWTVAAESLAAGGAEATPWEALLAEVAGGVGAVTSPAMHCLATELARVHAETGQSPDPGLARFLGGRCGTLGAPSNSWSWVLELAEGAEVGPAFERMKDNLRSKLASHLSTPGEQVGIGLAHASGQLVVVLGTSQPAVTLQPFSRVVEGERLEVRGRLRDAATQLTALVNQGLYGVAHCEVDPALALPEFRVSCPLLATDDHAWLQVFATPPGRVLAGSVLDVLAVRRADAALTYSRRALGDARLVRDEEAFRSSVVELVNRIRASASMQPLQLSTQQSRSMSGLVTPFFAAFLGQDAASAATVDRLTLGMMAGWEVQGGLIRDASLVTAVDLMTPDAARWVSDALDRPMGRTVLLDPDARVLALGAHVQAEPNLLAAVAVSYELFEPEAKPGELATSMLERLARVRKARGLGPTTQVQHMVGMSEAMADIQQGRATPMKALEYAMYEVASATGRSASGLVWETHDLDAIEFPPELLRRGNLMLGAGVTFYRPPGGAWGQYTVLFVVVDLPGGGDV